MMVTLGRQLLEEQGAEALVLGCGATTGLAARVARELAIPVLDPGLTAVKYAEMLVDTFDELLRNSEDAPLVLADRIQVQQVLLNLIINAAQAIPEGDPENAISRPPAMVRSTT